MPPRVGAAGVVRVEGEHLAVLGEGPVERFEGHAGLRAGDKVGGLVEGERVEPAGL